MRAVITSACIHARQFVLGAGLVASLVTSLAGCSPGTLPGSPSAIQFGGGAGRYNGTIMFRRVAGAFTISELPQNLDLSLVLRQSDQITGRFASAESSGSIQGVMTGDLAGGTFLATMLVQTQARQANGSSVACEGRGQVSGVLAGRNLTWTVTSVTYDNCSGFNTTSTAQAVATSPVPGPFPGLANVVVTIVGGSTIRRGTCLGGISGFPFTVEMVETAGINVTFDSTFVVEERRNFSASVSTTTLDMPFTDLRGGSRRLYDACSLNPGTYQALFSGSDANGNRIRVGTPLATFAP